MKHEELIKMFENQEEVYFENSYSEIVFHGSPENGFEAKSKNGKPYKVEIGNAQLTEAILEGNLITKEQYENY